MSKDYLERILFTEEQIQARIREIADEINAKFGDTPIFLVSILRGSTPFTVDLMKRLNMDVIVDYIVASSYGSGVESSGHLTVTKDLTLDIKGYDVIIIEDIVDSGLTLSKIKEMLQGRGAKSVSIASMLNKISRRVAPVDIDYLGFDVDDEFVIGYGLDYDQKYRNLPFIGVLKRSIYENK